MHSRTSNGQIYYIGQFRTLNVKKASTELCVCDKNATIFEILSKKKSIQYHQSHWINTYQIDLAENLVIDNVVSRWNGFAILRFVNCQANTDPVNFLIFLGTRYKAIR